MLFILFGRSVNVEEVCSYPWEPDFSCFCGTLVERQFNYCPRCGSKLKWPKNNDSAGEAYPLQ